jgi:competence protein ComEC
VKIDSVANFYSFQHKKIAVIDESAVFVPNVHPDILILRNSPKINLDRYLSQNKTTQIIADGSDYKSYVKLWKATCSKRKILFHDTAEKGFYKLN